MRIRYSRWDDTQDPFGADVPAAELLEELSDDIQSGGGAEGALSRLMRRGIQGRFNGLDALRARLRERRRREQAAMNLQGPLEEIRERLEEIVERERTALSLMAIRRSDLLSFRDESSRQRGVHPIRDGG